MGLFKKKKSSEDDVVEKLETELKVAVDTAESFEDLQRTVKLYGDFKSIKDKDNPWKKNIDPNTIITVAGSILSVLLILNFERIGIATSKAFSFIKR